jgi:hypothetical protein
MIWKNYFLPMKKDTYRIKIFEDDENDAESEIMTCVYEETPDFIQGFCNCLKITVRVFELQCNNIFHSPIVYNYTEYFIKNGENEEKDDDNETLSRRVYETCNDDTNKYHIYIHFEKCIIHHAINHDNIEFILGFMKAMNMFGDPDSVAIVQHRRRIDINKLLSKYK